MTSTRLEAVFLLLLVFTVKASVSRYSRLMLIPVMETGSVVSATSYFTASCLVTVQAGLSLCYFPVFVKVVDHMTIYYMHQYLKFHWWH